MISIKSIDLIDGGSGVIIFNGGKSGWCMTIFYITLVPMKNESNMWLQKFPSVQNIKAATRSLLFTVFGHHGGS